MRTQHNIDGAFKFIKIKCGHFIGPPVSSLCLAEHLMTRPAGVGEGHVPKLHPALDILQVMGPSPDQGLGLVQLRHLLSHRDPLNDDEVFVFDPEITASDFGEQQKESSHLTLMKYIRSKQFRTRALKFYAPDGKGQCWKVSV